MVHLKIVNIVNCMLCIFYHHKTIFPLPFYRNHIRLVSTAVLELSLVSEETKDHSL